MSRFRIDHPSKPDLYAEAGHDHMLGFFAETFIERRDKPKAVLDVFKLGRAVTLHDCFEFLISEHFVTRDDLEAALVWLQDGGREPRSRGAMRVAEIVMSLRASD
jgi:hypothetical protein